jgi:hypothetical protein
VLRVLDRASSEIKRLPPEVVSGYLDRYLVDFLTLRRDLKLAYKAYQAMDARANWQPQGANFRTPVGPEWVS